MGGYGHGREGSWEGLKQVVLVRVRREYLDYPDKGDSIEDHYYLTSLDPEGERGGGGESLLAIARGHWGIENRLHHKKDRSMGEDQQPAKRGASFLCRLRGTVLGLLQQIEGESTAMKQMTK